MKLKYNANYNTILLQKENQILAVSRAWTGDYISLETSPFQEDIITFEISKESEGKVENQLYDVFSKLISEFISLYNKLGYASYGLEINTENRIIKFLENTISNSLIIEEKEERIILTFINKQKNFQNNRVILDRSGEVAYGYFFPLQDLYYELIEITKSNENNLTKKID